MYLTEVVSVVTEQALFAHLGPQHVVFLDSETGPLNSEQEIALKQFVKGGGGLVCSGNAVEMYRGYTLLGEMLGDVRGFSTPHCEIVLNISAPDTYLTRRLDPTFAVHDSLYLLQHIPTDATSLVQTTWQFARYTVAYTRTFGQGRIFCTTLGNKETYAHPSFQQLLGRAIRYVAGVDTEEIPARVAMIGYGAIGLEHGTAISNVPGLEYALVCDHNEKRLDAARLAFPGIRTSTSLLEVAEDPTIDMVIVSTPPNTHASISLQMLRAGKHIVSEKPFCLTSAEADEMIELAQVKQRALTVYQCRRWDPDYLAIQNILKRGDIGPIFHMETFIGGYSHPCDYWHSHEPISGGVFYDWGSHYLDWILQLIPDKVLSVRGVRHKRVWHDITNADQSSVYLRFAGGQEAEFMHSDIAAALKPKWYILGEQGAIVGNWRHESVKTRRWSGDLIEEQLAPSEALPELVVTTRDTSGALHRQQLTLPTPPAFAFHRNLANHLHSGEALAVPPEESRRNILVMEAAKLSAEQGGTIIEIDDSL